ncbi:MAG: ornithine carbamoyltransferase [Peptostreptococcales bacterium]
MNLLGRSLLTLLDFTPDEINYLIETAAILKENKKKKMKQNYLEGKNIVLLFEKTSTRTRCAFEVAAMDEGAGVTFLGSQDSQVGKKESIIDTAKVLGRFYDGIEFRGFHQETVETLAKYSGVPVFNGLTDSYHPTQVLADLLTIKEHSPQPLQENHVVFVGDGRNNMAISLMIACAKLGIDFTCLAPQSLFPGQNILTKVSEIAKISGSKLNFSENTDALKGADVIYTDIWVSMGEEHLVEERVKILSPYKVTSEMLEKTNNPNVLFMHCLPSFHDMTTGFAKNIFEEYGLDICEVSDEVFNGKHSIVFDEAENRLHTIKAILVTSMSEKWYESL